MAAIDTSRVAGFGAPAHQAGFLRQAFARFADWRDRRATRSALARLSDHELEDIGLSRGEIDSICR